MTKRNVATVADGLQNVVTGLGGDKSKRVHNQWVYGMLNDWGSLDAAYQTNWIARTIVDVPAKDMTREWRTIKSDGAELIEGLEKELCVPQVVEEALAWARLFGGAGIVMLTGQDLTKPLNLNRVKRGSLERLLVFDRWDLSAHTINTWDVLAENYLQPEFYTVRGGSQQIHWTHVVRFYGERLPRRWMQHTQGWGDSVLRKCIDDVADMVAAKDGIAELMQEANVDLIKREGLSDDLTTDQDEAILKRYQLFRMMKSNVQMALLDGDETYERKTLNLSGVAPIIEQFITWISGAARMPVTKLFGTAAKGLNATGEGDLYNYYDDIRSWQKSSLSMSMRYLDEVLVRSALGRWPESFDYIWNPLEQPDIVQTAQASVYDMQRDTGYLEAGVVQKSQIQRSLQSAERYQFDDDKIEELEELENGNLFDDVPPVVDTTETQRFVDAWLRTTNDYIEKCGSQWCVFSKSGEKLGTHPTESEALAQLRAIESNK
ncbi:portal protein [Vibrio phage CP-T1]|uniref:portal protein n=1 Tax=Vibrio phage CP-T1 TaxID=10689 RepID=UPI0002536CA9|nr:portal protein [Vibrio phage CP-T1]AFC22407.1 putative portal protein [Vibrio phage CP-T1]AIA08739.1 putative portal protein [Vibrio phage 24]